MALDLGMMTSLLKWNKLKTNKKPWGGLVIDVWGKLISNSILPASTSPILSYSPSSRSFYDENSVMLLPFLKSFSGSHVTLSTIFLSLYRRSCFIWSICISSFTSIISSLWGVVKTAFNSPNILSFIQFQELCTCSGTCCLKYFLHLLFANSFLIWVSA